MGLSGLTDSEGSFMLFRGQDGYRFKFQIQLHIDDLKMLHFIHSTFAFPPFLSPPKGGDYRKGREGDSNG